MRGRPKKPPGESRKTFFQIRMTEEERDTLKRAAEARSLDASAWARSELLALARKILAKQGGG